MKRAVIIHCWEGYPNYCWYPYVKRELGASEFKVQVPAFPDTALPKLDKWLSKLQEVIGEPDEELFLIGHSLGCITILRYLESLKEGQQIGGVVLVAGFTDDLNFDEIKDFFITDIDFKKIRAKAGGFVAIHSDDDPYVALKYGDIFKEKLGAEVIVKRGAKHFSGEIENEESCTQLPDVVKSVRKLAGK